MNNFERITASPEALGDFLGALPILSGPWDDDFHRVFCDSCDAENCDAENCAHQAERNSPTWWLKRAYTGSGPVKTDSTNPYKRQAADLRLEALHQRDRFGRNLLATELEEAAATIEDLAEKLEAADNGESLNTSIPRKTALGLSWNTACVRARCAVFPPAVIRRCAWLSPGRTGSHSRDIIGWTTLERSCFTRRRRLPPWPKA